MEGMRHDNTNVTLTTTGEVYEIPMSRRDYFAAAALTGLIPSSDNHGRHTIDELTNTECAEWACQYADALLVALDE